MSMTSGGLYVFVGGSRGLGLELARGLAGSGGVAVLASRNEQELEQARREIAEATWARVVTEVVDLTQPDSVRAFVGRLRDQGEPLRLLANTAAGFYKGRFSDLDPNEVEDLIKATYSGFASLLLHVTKDLERAKVCDVINVTSISSATTLDSGKSSAMHISTKAAAHILGIVAGRELVGSGLRVTSIAPGTFARKGRAGIAEPTLVRIVKFLLELPQDAWIEELVIRPTGLLQSGEEDSGK